MIDSVSIYYNTNAVIERIATRLCDCEKMYALLQMVSLFNSQCVFMGWLDNTIFYDE